MFHALIRTDNSPAQTLVRLALALVLFPPSARNVLGWFGGAGFADTLILYQQLGFASWLVIVMMAVELGGSVLLLLGLCTRLSALAIGFGLLMQIRALTRGTELLPGWYALAPDLPLAFLLLALGCSLALFLGGGGALSLDRRLQRGRARAGLSLSA